MNLAHSIQLQRRIRTYATIGILVTGLLVAIATAIPLYHDAREHATTSYIEDAHARARSAGQFIGKATDIARQIASRSGIRTKLEAYNRWEINKSQFVDYATPRLRDALTQDPNIAGLVRLDRDKHPVIEIGQQLPAELLRIAASQEPVASGPLSIDDKVMLLVSMPILSRNGARAGTDILSFGMAALGELLSRESNDGPHTRQLLFNSVDKALVEFNHEAPGGRLLDAGQPEHPFLERAAGGGSGLELLKDVDGSGGVIAFAPVPEVPGWSLALVTPARTFGTPILFRLASPLLMIVLLVLAGAWLTARAIRPVADKVLQQSRKLGEMSESMALAASVFEGSPQAVLILDAGHRVLETNEACYAITGFGLAELQGRTMCQALCLRPDENSMCDQLWRDVAETGEWHGEAHLVRRYGEPFPAWCSVSAVRDGGGKPHHYIAMLSDISDKKQAEDRIRHLAQHDSLTGLPNRSLLADRLEHALDRGRRGGHRVALLFIDLDRFKHVNDSLGHPVGDRLLQEVARRLNSVVRQQDTLARQGGDEFVVILEDIEEPDDAARVAVKLLSTLEAPVLLDGHEIFVGGSIGISLFPGDGDSNEALLRCADSAMYEAKEQGRNTYRFYTAEQTRISRERFELESGLRRAIERDELRLFYQPQAACADGRLIGVEALVRWQHPERGLVLPDRFIPLAEEIGLIGQIGDWVLNTACAQARQWAQAGHPLRVAVNLSSHQVVRNRLFDAVKAVLDRTGLSPGLLELEITEGHVLKHVEECIAELHRVKTLGVSLAIDDFGTGYSSLSYLKRLPADRLKIDRSFVEGIPDDHDDISIVATILSMARNLGMDVIAEGVETPAQIEHLTAARCGEYQGYLLGKPMPPDALQDWMESYRSKHAGS
jgi:diguanylate cyclase (GGDEF)-like protein/PAS domain S-box-containing protein